ncbi:MAG: GNAT superfamily N-acetyltransferase [Gammaproteobacteria bacterium]|jgi:GNAT superfamily N-acetyltransferase
MAAETFPDRRDLILEVFEPIAYAQTLADLPKIHARPKGAILLADLEERPIGCVMYLEMEPGIAEVKQLFVDDSGRGLGLGKALLTEMLDRMRTDGHVATRFSSARFLTHARRLYESLGFAKTPHPPEFPKHLRQVDYFMQRPL